MQSCGLNYMSPLITMKDQQWILYVLGQSAMDFNEIDMSTQMQSF